jgi:WD40 repeat protein/class 3 adenylate cyclase
MTSLPEGTVTFMFTDIQGSTRLLDELGPERYGEVLARQREILRRAFAEFGGTEIDTQGDAFFSSFPRATTAVQAAVHIQRSLEEVDWPQETAVRVRMGLHTGEPWLIEEGYVGMDVHRAARIAHVGHGGQVLLSATTTPLVQDELPKQVRLSDLGLHRLKDMRRPEHIHMLKMDGLPSDFPPLTSMEVVAEPGDISMPEHGRRARVVGESPYRGLAAFREEDARFFFGREAFTLQLKEAVDKGRLVAVVVGSSGSGKSSAVFAGLLPELRQDGTWEVVSFRPGTYPFQALSSAIMPLLEPETGEAERLFTSQKLAQGLRSGEISLFHTLSRVLDQLPDISRILLILDQFEELYTLCPDPQIRQNFTDELLAAVDGGAEHRINPVSILLTLRADFMGEALTNRPFADAMQEGALLLGPMKRKELRAAIEMPAELQGAAFEPGLVDRILDDVGEEPGNLPLLEFALTLLWDEMDNGWMTHEIYDQIGRVSGALARYADDVFEELDAEERDQTRRMCVQLVQPGQGTEDTRRVASRGELIGIDWDLVQHLADQRLVVTGLDDSSTETVEVVHEALIRGWGRLRTWMADDRLFRNWQEGLRAAIASWESSDRDRGALLRGVPLLKAEEWLADRPEQISAVEREYIRASSAARLARQEKSERQRAERERLRRRVTQILAAGLAVALILAFFAGWQWFASQRSFREAQRSRLALEARDMLASGSSGELPALLALQSIKLGYSPEAQAALYQSIEHGYASEIIQLQAETYFPQFSPDGRYLLTPETSADLSIWRTEDWTLVQKLTGHDGAARGAFSSDGEQVVSAGDDGTVRVWDVDTGGEIHAWQAHSAIVNHAVFSPDGDYILSTSDDQTAKLWQADSGRLVRTYWVPTLDDGRTNYEGGSANWLFSPDFTEDGERFLTGSSDLLIRLWDVESGEVLKTFPHEQGIQIQTVRFSPDEELILSVPLANYFVVWDAETGERVHTFTLPEDNYITSAGFSPDGKKVISGSWDNLARVWDLATGEVIRTFHGHGGNVSGLAFSPSGEQLVTIGEDFELRVWDYMLDFEPDHLPQHEGRVYETKISPDGTMLATGDDSEDVHLWDLISGKLLFNLPGHTGGTIAADFTDDGRRLVTVSWTNEVRVWNLTSQKEVLEFQPFSPEKQEFIDQIKFSSDGEKLVGGTSKGSIHIWDADTGDGLKVIRAHSGELWGLDLSTDENYAASAGWDGMAYIWDLAMEEQVHLLSNNGAVNGVSFLPGENLLLTTSEDQFARIWEVETGKMQREIPITAGHFTNMVVSGDGSSFFLGGGDGIIRQYDLESGAEIGRYPGHDEIVFRLALSPDGNKLVSGGWDGTVRVWDTNLDVLISFVCEHLPRDLTAEERLTYDIETNEPTCSQ